MSYNVVTSKNVHLIIYEGNIKWNNCTPITLVLYANIKCMFSYVFVNDNMAMVYNNTHKASDRLNQESPQMNIFFFFETFNFSITSLSPS